MENQLKILFFLGRPFSPLNASIMRIREKLYTHNLFSRTKLSVPVISVGNLVLGGTGKTPMIRYLAKFLQKNGMQPAIISRGYKGKAANEYNIVSDGKSLLLSAEDAGDEPFMLASSLPTVPVLTGKKRTNPAAKAMEMGADCLLLDDGFQHLAIERDLDIVLFDATYQAGNSRLLPGGPLREPISALARADCFVVTGTTEKNRTRAEKFAALLRQKFSSTPVFLADRSALIFEDLQQQSLAAEKLGPCFAFCGIAVPQRFAQSLEESSINLCGFTSFTDHAQYTQSQLEKIEKEAGKYGAQALVTTEKDAVKIRSLSLSLPLYIAKFDLLPANDFTTFLKDNWPEILIC